jgi:hypothetical protein
MPTLRTEPAKFVVAPPAAVATTTVTNTTVTPATAKRARVQ